MHAVLFVFLAAVALNSHNAGGTHSLDEAKAQIVSAFENSVPDYSGLNQ